MNEAPSLDFSALVAALEAKNGLTRTLGITTSIDAEGRGVLRVTITPELSGSPSVAHGGAVATLMDAALGAAALAYSVPRDKMVSTVELKINFLRPARVGQRLVTSTTTQSAGRSLMVVSGEARDEDSGQRVAFASATFNLYATEVVRGQQS